MPSPLAHIAAACALHEVAGRRPEMKTDTLGLILICSLLPDIDAFVGLARRDFGRYHNNLTHSLAFAAAAGALAGWWTRRRAGVFSLGFRSGFLAYAGHLALDYWSTRRGLLLLWPLSTRRFVSPRRLFYGFRWGRGVWSRTHLWTIFTELAFAFVLWLVVKGIRKEEGSRCE